MLKYAAALLIGLELLLGAAHLMLPSFEWGQGRASPFDLSASLSLASWLAAMQLVAVAGLCLVAMHRVRRSPSRLSSGWVWPVGALAAAWLSFGEITRLPERLGLLGLPEPDVYQRLVLGALAVLALAAAGWFLIVRVRAARGNPSFAVAWLALWGVERLLTLVIVAGATGTSFVAARELTWLLGCTLLLVGVGEVALGAPDTTAATPDPEPRRKAALLCAVAGTTFGMIVLQVVLFQLLTIFGDYLLANSIISVALVGIAIGGLIGFACPRRFAGQAMLTAGLLFPVSILLALGTAVSLMETPLPASLLLAVPFAAGGVVITVALVEADTHVVYAMDLLGAGAGALAVPLILGHFREEGSLILLAAAMCLVAGCLVWRTSRPAARAVLLALALAGAAGLGATGWLNRSTDWFNVVREALQRRYPDVEMVASRSSFVARYDVVRRRPDETNLKAVENGRIIDTIRPLTVEHYQVDPRVPHTLIPEPDILILGVSGEGVTKTCRALGGAVWGVEINPVVVDLMRNDLVRYNGDCYAGLQVEVIDGRSYVEQQDRQFDMITLINAHFTRGSASGRAAGPEYLHTAEALHTYLDRLNDRGVVIVEEPLSTPFREPPIWKLLLTMRQVLLERGAESPEAHFFVFQWRTRNNNYIQLLLKKTPFTDQEVDALERWLYDVDHIDEISDEIGRQAGPITSARTTLLHAPGRDCDTTYTRIVRGDTTERFRLARNLRTTTDDRPFPFDVDPRRPGITGACARTTLLLGALLPFVAALLPRHRRQMAEALPFVGVAALVGFGYFLIEMVLIQRFEIYLGSPIVTFSTVLGTLLVGSGVGSLASRRLGLRGLLLVLGALVVLLIAGGLVLPVAFAAGIVAPLGARIGLASAAVILPALCMGMVLPTFMRLAKRRAGPPAAALLFAVNAAASAVAVPIALSISTAHGFFATFAIGALLYALTGVLVLALERSRFVTISTAVAVVAVLVILVSPYVRAPDRPADDSGTPEPYRVYAISYGKSRYHRARIVRGGADREESFEWMVWLIVGHGRTILVDTGFLDHELARRWRFREYTPPPVRLAELGIEPDAITDVVLTHAHWDHAGGLEPYDKAQVWIQADEFRHAASTLSAGRPEAGGMRWGDLEQLLRAERAGRLVQVRGDTEIAAGVWLRAGGAHTPGSQYVEVEALDGRVILSGDVTYLYENSMRHLPIGTSVDHAANLATIRRMHRRAASPFYIVPGHDPRVMRWFPTVAPGVVEITAIPDSTG